MSAAPVAPFVVPFFTGADVLPSLDSEMLLNLRADLVVAAPLVVPVPVAAAAFLPLPDPPVELAVVEAEAVCFRPVAPVRVDRAFSARLLKRLDALCCFTGDVVPVVVPTPGRAISSLPPGVVRGRGRTLGEAGDNTLGGLAGSASRTGWPRCFFLGCSGLVASPWSFLLGLRAWSLSAALVRVRIREERRNSNLVCLGGRSGPDLDDVAE